MPALVLMRGGIRVRLWLSWSPVYTHPPLFLLVSQVTGGRSVNVASMSALLHAIDALFPIVRGPVINIEGLTSKKLDVGKVRL